MGLFARLAGVINDFFQFGGPTGFGINYNTGSPALEARNAANSAYAIMRGADPVGNNDLVTLEYLNGNPPGFLKQDGNSFGAELFAGTNDNFPASFGAFTAQVPQAFVVFTPNNGVAPVASLDTKTGTSGVVDVGSVGALTVNIGNASGAEATNIASGNGNLGLTSTNRISIVATNLAAVSGSQVNVVSTVNGIYILTGNQVVALQNNVGGPTAPSLQWWDGANTNFVGFKSPDTLAGNTTWTLPAADGTAGQVLTTNGATQLSWAAAPTAPGSVVCISYNITNTPATQSSVSSIPANALILDTKLNITTPFSLGATIEIGQTGSLALLQATGDNDPQAAALYEASQATSWGGSALPVVTTIGGAPGAGAGTVTVLYAVPIN